MAASLVIDWLDENEERAYPLKQVGNRQLGGIISLDSIIVDAALTVNTFSQLTSQLTQISINNNKDLTFTVSGQVPFVVPYGVAFPYYCRNTNGSLVVFSSHTKILADASSALFPITLSGIVFEDTVTTEYAGQWEGVSGISHRDSQCGSLTPCPIYTGDILWLSGKQLHVDVLSHSDIKISAGAGFGDPIQCVEQPQAASNSFSCLNFISYINGASPNGGLGPISFIASNNLKIINEPLINTIKIGLAFSTEDVCASALLNPIPSIPK